MKASTVLFSEEEKKIRKKWIELLIVFNIPIFLYFLAGFVTGLKEGFVYLIALTFFASLVFAWSYSLYRCAYKNTGTAWLTFNTVLSIIGLGISLIELIFVIFTYSSLRIQNPEINTFSYILTYLLGIAISIPGLLWTFSSLKLRKINKKYNNISYNEHVDLAQRMEGVVQKMQMASDIEELTTHFHTAIQLAPQFETHFSKEYEKRKEEISTKELV